VSGTHPPFDKALALRQARRGLMLAAILPVAGEAVTVALFLLTGAFDLSGMLMLLGGTVSIATAAWVAVGIFRAEIRRLQALPEVERVPDHSLR
jgi:hypothetical protein